VLVNGLQKRPPIPTGCPAPLRRLLERCWQQDPALRPTAEGVVAALRAAAQTMRGQRIDVPLLV
jgi:hypothetical protein